MDIREKAELLRQHEIFCYQISFYLVQDEQLSIKAASAALLELACDPYFLKGNAELQKGKAKQAAIRSALRVKAKASIEAVC
ncbi:hypothetical protein [Paenibacillus sp. NPDC058174]|uniref:hypothetical protein n=1 Tax=Paenibacillus sp. NPDC058174 TaxID=3346366 RepID=UPI0036D8E501